MRIDLTPFTRTGETALPFALKGALSAQDMPFAFCGPVEATGKVMFLGEGEFALEGTMHAALELMCDRCLEPVQQTITVPFDERFAREGSEQAAEDAERYLYRGEAIELSEMLTQALLLHLPMRVLCQEDCRGLCPVCGRNRNINECYCAPESSSPFDALRTHFQEEEV